MADDKWLFRYFYLAVDQDEAADQGPDRQAPRSDGSAHGRVGGPATFK